MAWYGVITDVGKMAMEEHLASGVGLNLNVVKTGTATVPAANMRAMTGMSAQADTGSIIGKQGTQNGAEVQISIQASATRYVMKEIGLFATMEDESTVLIAYYNDDGIGVEVPAVADFPDFNYVLFCLLDIINSDDLEITMDSTHAILISQIANNLTTAADTEGKVLDARQGKVLNDTKADKANAVFTGSISLNRKAGTTVGENSIAVGSANRVEASGNRSAAFNNGIASGTASFANGSGTASGSSSHAEGSGATASGNHSHAEGLSTISSGLQSHSEGSLWVEGVTDKFTEASGNASHAEGRGTKASGDASHTWGKMTIAQKNNQTAFGKYNVADTGSGDDGSYAEIVGNGSADNARSNARVLDWNGNEKLKGDLYLECNEDSSGGTSVKQALASLNSKIYQFSNTEVSVVGGTNANGLFVIDYIVPTSKTVTVSKLQIAANSTDILSNFTNATSGNHIVLYTNHDQSTYAGKLMTITFTLS